MEIEKKALTVIARVFNLNLEDLSGLNTRDEIDSWDSLGHLQLILQLESEFNIKLKMEEINKINTIEDCVKIVEKNSANK